MPRRRVPPDERQRSSKACEACRATKKRCDDRAPCSNCARRGLGLTCTNLVSSTGRVEGDASSAGHHFLPQTSPRTAPHAGRHIVTPESVVESTPSSVYPNTRLDEATVFDGVTSVSRLDKKRRQRLLNQHNLKSQQSTRPASPSGDTADETEQPRILLSARGEKVYVGSSAAISFLQFLRRLLRHHGGASAFTESQHRHTMLEVDVQEGYGDFVDYLDHAAKVALIGYFLTASSGFMNLLLEDEISQLLTAYENDGENPRLSPEDIATLYVILAIGAKCRSNDESDRRTAATYFARGQKIAFQDMLHDPSLKMVVNFILMAFYMLASSRRNTGLLYLGIASKTATILGLHVMDLNKGLRPEMARRRIQAWKSLRILDVQCNAILGRPSSAPYVSTQDDHWQSAIVGKGNHRSLALNAHFDLSLLMEPISQKLTRQAALDLEAAESHLQKLRSWATRLPEPLRQSISKAKRDVSARVHQENNIGNIHVACAYYFSVILVTRHFLIATLTPQLRQSDPSATRPVRDISLSASREPDKESELAKVCVEAAAFLIQMCTEASEKEILLDNMCILQAWVFAASLVLGYTRLVPAGGLHDGTPSAFANSLDLVGKFAKLSAQSQRNYEILTSFSAAIEEYHAKKSQEQESVANPYLEQISRPVADTMDADDEVPAVATAASDGFALGALPGSVDASITGRTGEGFGDFNFPEVPSGGLMPSLSDDVGFQLFWDGYSPPLLAGMQMANDDYMPQNWP